MTDTIDWIKSHWRDADVVMRLIAVNVAVFLLIRLAAIVLMFTRVNIDEVLQWVMVPPGTFAMLARPWTLISYMFCHYEVMHLLFNMLWLYWFGRMFTYIATPKQLFALYIYGGVAGAVLYAAMSVVAPWIGGGGLIGASAAIMAIVIATAVITPDVPVRMLFFGEVKLKWVAVVTVILFALGLTGDNAGGHAAHLGGVAMGAVYGVAFSRGRDLAQPFNRLADWLCSAVNRRGGGAIPRAKRYHYQPSDRRKPSTELSSTATLDDIDPILDKIKKSGYTSLTNEEKKKLFEASSRMK